MEISGNIVDVLQRVVYPGTLHVEGGRIAGIDRGKGDYDTFILPGFIDSHIHIESTLLAPAAFARLAVLHGTVAVVADPHEIANVLGIPGVEYMIESSRKTLFKFFFGAPSCVPATVFETAGARFGPQEIDALLAKDDILFLSEMMNYPGVLQNDPLVTAILKTAGRHGKPIDGHAPGLRGKDLETYIRAGITTDHESVDLQEGEEKLEKGMKLLIREGSAVRNFEALWPLIDRYPGQCMLCTDDIYPDALRQGHIDGLVRRALGKGLDPMNVLTAASVTPVRHYGLEVGLLRRDDPADFLIVDNLKEMRIVSTWIGGRCVAGQGKTMLPAAEVAPLPAIRAARRQADDFALRAASGRIRVIEAADGRLLTEMGYADPLVVNGLAVADPSRDILKLAVVNRYHDAAPALGFIRGFNLKQGALASSVGHDSHNILAVGVSDEEICAAINLVIDSQGGLAAKAGREQEVLPLPVAGLMSDRDGLSVATRYETLNRTAHKFGCRLQAPFMTLSFMSLLVEPELKLSDKGLFDSRNFRFVSLFCLKGA